MKNIHRITVLTSSAIVFLTSCSNVNGPGPNRRSPAVVKAATRNQRAQAQPYYKSNAEGSYYYTTEAEEQSNSDYRPTVRRNVSSGGGY